MSALVNSVDSPKGVSHLIGAGASVTLFLLSLLAPTKVPVVWFERADAFEVTEQSVEFGVEMYKWRKCDPVLKYQFDTQEGSREVRHYLAFMRGGNGRWYETTLHFIDDDSPDSAHEPAWFRRVDVGRWSVAMPGRLVKPPIAIKVPMVHLCGEEKDIPVTKTMGPFRISTTEGNS